MRYSDVTVRQHLPVNGSDSSLEVATVPESGSIRPTPVCDEPLAGPETLKDFLKRGSHCTVVAFALHYQWPQVRLPAFLNLVQRKC